MQLDLDDIQGLFARGYRRHGYARFTVFTVRDPAASRALLEWLLPRLTTAAPFSGDAAINVAFTPSGLRQLGLPESVIAGFSAEFIEGMATANRSRFLGDVGESDRSSWAWGGPRGPSADGLILLYATDRASLRASGQNWRGAWWNWVSARPPSSGPESLAIRSRSASTTVSRAHHCWSPKAAQAERTVPAGEFRPRISGSRHGRSLTDPCCGVRRPRALAAPRARLGAAQSTSGATARPGPAPARTGTLTAPVTRSWPELFPGRQTNANLGQRASLTAKMVGRWPSGAPLISAPDRDVPALRDDNTFAYAGRPARAGLPDRCAHPRADPRDSLPPGPPLSLDTSDLHRLLRRARSYGPNQSGGRRNRLYFICLAGNTRETI